MLNVSKIECSCSQTFEITKKELVRSGKNWLVRNGINQCTRILFCNINTRRCDRFTGLAAGSSRGNSGTVMFPGFEIQLSWYTCPTNW